MNDDELITQLQDRLTARADTIHAPAGLADHARHHAHRTIARRAAIAGVPSLLAAALAATLVNTDRSSSSGSEVDATYAAHHHRPA